MERHCESKVSWSRTQHDAPGQKLDCIFSSEKKRWPWEILAHLPPPILLNRNEEPSLKTHKKRASYVCLNICSAYTNLFRLESWPVMVLRKYDRWVCLEVKTGFLHVTENLKSHGVYVFQFQVWKVMEFKVTKHSFCACSCWCSSECAEGLQKTKHAVDSVIILFATCPHYLCYFPS